MNDPEWSDLDWKGLISRLLLFLLLLVLIFGVDYGCWKTHNPDESVWSWCSGGGYSQDTRKRR